MAKKWAKLLLCSHVEKKKEPKQPAKMLGRKENILMSSQKLRSSFDRADNSIARTYFVYQNHRLHPT